MRVRSLQGDERRVYDLTVEDQHVFFAEGVLVSNCADALQYLLVGGGEARVMLGRAEKPKIVRTLARTDEFGRRLAEAR